MVGVKLEGLEGCSVLSFSSTIVCKKNRGYGNTNFSKWRQIVATRL